jgi:hypothetical protein
MSGLPALSLAATIILGDGSQYEIKLQSHDGNTWTYFVREVKGKSLSHWNLGIQSCMDKGAVVDSSPKGDETDGSTSFKGMKWDVGDGFTEGTFSITLNGDYPEATIKAQAKAGKRGNERTGDVKGPDCNAEPLPPEPLSAPPTAIDDEKPNDDEKPATPAGAGDCDTLYAVHDDGLNDTQFVTIGSSQVEKLGDIFIGVDGEGLDVSSYDEVYVSSGDDTDRPGHLFELYPDTVELDSVGDICFDFPGSTGEVLAPGLVPTLVCGKEVSSISFKPTDDTLWGWAEECGLIEIDLYDPENSRLEFAFPNDGGVTCLTKNPRDVTPIVEDMTWDNNGENIYYALGYEVPGSEVWVYNASTPEVRLVANMGGNVEALEMLPEFDDKLLVGVHNSATLMVLDIATGTFSSSPVTVGEFNDIEAMGMCPGGNPIPPRCIMGEGTGWMYTRDSINDGTGKSPESSSTQVGNTYFEIYGIAVKMDNDTVTVAINSRLPAGGVQYPNAVIAFGDVIFDFDGKKYGIRFDSSNDSLDGSPAAVGLYEVTELKSVTKANHGHRNFTSYDKAVTRKGGAPSLGDMPNLNNGYFGNRDKMPTSIESGVKVTGDGFEMLDAAQLAAKGLDFATNLGIPASAYDPNNPYNSSNQKPANELGEYTVGFSFKRQADMTGEFKAFIFTECGNDGIVMVNEPLSCD